MGNWVESVIAFLDRFWPLERIDQWERGILMIFGRVIKRPYFLFDQTLPPGIYPKLPWFVEVQGVGVAKVPISTPLCNITLADGKTLSYSAQAIVRVVEPAKALVDVEDYKISTGEILTAVLSDKLAEVGSDRLSAAKQGRLLSDLRRWVHAETMEFGVEVLALRFTNFALNQKAYRILTESATSAGLSGAFAL